MDWKRFRHDGRARRRAGRLFEQVRSGWDETLDALRWARIELHEVADRVPQLMIRYGLSSYDAVHVAVAEHTEVRDMATLDTDFAAVPASRLRIYVPKTKVPYCRGVRRA